MLLAVLCLAIIWLITISLVLGERRQAVEQSILASQNISSIVAADIDEVFGRALLYAQLSSSALKPNGDTPSIPAPLTFGDSAYLRLAVFGSNAELKYVSSRGEIEPEMRELVRVVLQDSSALHRQRRPFIGRPAANWTIPVAVPIVSGDEPIGVFAANIDLGYLLRLYKESTSSKDTALEVLDFHGQQLFEIRGGMVSDSDHDALSSYSGVIGRGKKLGRIEVASQANNITRIGSYHILDRFPIAVAITRDSVAVEGELTERHRSYLWRGILMSVVTILLSAGLTVLAQRQRRLYQELTESEVQKQALIEQLEQEKARAFQLASHDFLTGLPNRMMFYELATVELARARRSRNLYAVYFLDLDKFKAINDTLGHAVGDLLLKAVAERLRGALREYDLVARFGGDEFIILVSELNSEERASKIAEKLVDCLSAPYLEMNGHSVDTTPSIGIALCPRDGQDIDTLILNADAAMYSAKRSGRGKYRFYDDSLNTSSARSLELLTRFRRAIRDNEFCLHYQMRISLKDLRPVGMEALLRWQHPKHGLIFPGDFIGIAEEHNYITPLGHWIVTAVCTQLAQWRDAGNPLLPVAINISARQLSDDSLVDVILSNIREKNIPVELIEIEVTESCFLECPETAQRVLEKLQQAGIQISLDDYGTGFSGLSHLKQLPISAVKIDRSFIRDIRNDTSDAMIVSSTIALSHNLGLKVVAEGVETKEQVVHLKTAGCDEVQGFYFHRPAPASDVAVSLQNFGRLPVESMRAYA
ncbi:diguanylate cyclase [Noviherbaspirillum autotrophicum]|uniref:Diguanylate cyclase n=1 Tax=Noviherbaspirillum autotrophicum TaxID=709839 RepID=A0A0C2C0H0_9BURK|nr:diguanylate cyclase [Noviherbaspirillum autotrophicum]KIF83796.1 diguanylate cyclase [Noviherbaspirillum autotrophicum]KIF84121.1 diguanylate cyclase [Noviherbaspirillum autotrophicum]